MLVEAGHTVGGMTRSANKIDLIESLGAEPIVCDVYDGEALSAAVVAFHPDLVLHELTDLPDDLQLIREGAALNARMRTEGTRNLIAAARAASVPKVVAQSVAWALPPGKGADAVRELEESVLAEDGLVLRYGQFYGPDTYYPHGLPEDPRVGIDEAARRTVEALAEPSGILTVVD